MKEGLREITLEYHEEFRPFYHNVSLTLAKNDQAKGHSFSEMTEAELLDGLIKQLEDIQTDPGREDYYANMGAYAGMLWIQFTKRAET